MSKGLHTKFKLINWMRLFAVFLAFAQSTEINSDCNNCVADGGRQCITDGKFKEGTCCDRSADVTHTGKCISQSENQFCIDDPTIFNPLILDFACPANDQWCPDDSTTTVEIDAVNTIYDREHFWDIEIPNDQYQWDCKYVVRASDSLLQTLDDDAYITIQLENYGFDETIFLIQQERGEFENFDRNDPDSKVTIYKPSFSELVKYRANMDILVQFKPLYSNNDIKYPNGTLQFRTWIYKDVPAEETTPSDTTDTTDDTSDSENEGTAVDDSGEPDISEPDT